MLIPGHYEPGTRLMLDDYKVYVVMYWNIFTNMCEVKETQKTINEKEMSKALKIKDQILELQKQIQDIPYLEETHKYIQEKGAKHC